MKAQQAEPNDEDVKFHANLEIKTIAAALKTAKKISESTESIEDGEILPAAKVESILNSDVEEDDSFAEISNNRKVEKKLQKTPIPCDVCGKLLSSNYRLKVHLRTHTG
jgi:hypothetical protein